MSASAIDLRRQPDVATRLLAGVSVPDTPLITRAIEFARERSEPYLFNHVMRSWLFAATLAQRKQNAHDSEVLAVITILHDVGLAEVFDGPLRFEVEGANAARATEREVDAIVEAFPRLGMKEQFKQAVCRIVETRPTTTYDNFARDFGERFVPGYKPASTVDYLLNSPFNE